MFTCPCGTPVLAEYTVCDPCKIRNAEVQAELRMWIDIYTALVRRQAEAAARDRTLPKPSPSAAEVVADLRQPAPVRERKSSEQAAKTVGASGFIQHRAERIRRP